MGRLATTFRRLKKANEAALVAYVTVGYPSLDLTLRRRLSDEADELRRLLAVRRAFPG